MSGSFPFAEMLRKLMKDVERRDEWKRSTAQRHQTEVPDLGNPWKSADFAKALGVHKRTAQTWTTRRHPQEPSESNMLELERLLLGKMPAPQQRQAFRDAWRLQQDLHRRREADEHWDIEERDSPYRGIAASLTENDAAVFFGRTAQLAALTEKVRRRPYVFVIGASGAGKSSLVWAGLIPNLIYRNAISGSHAWCWRRITPGTQSGPLEALAGALALKEQAASGGGRQADRRAGWVSQHVGALLAGRSGDSKLLLFIDQFEELFTLVQDAGERAAFIDALAELIDTKRVRIVATMRAEFVGHCARSEQFGEELAGWLSAASFWLAPPGPDDLREMIAGPAQRAGLSIDESLIDEIVADTGSKPGNLPLMAFALERLFDGYRATGHFSAAVYRSFGGIEGAIADRASSAFDALASSIGAEADHTLSEVFRDLVDVDEESGAAMRRQIPLTSLADSEPARKLVDRFVECRLFVRGSGTLEVAHEALFRNWPRLADWVNARKNAFVLRQRLMRDASEWERKGKPKAYLWSDEQALDAATMVRTLNYQPTAIESEFLGPINHAAMAQGVESNATTHEDRARIGVRLALLGDRRPGVGVRSDGLPDIEWLKVEAGEVKRAGSDAVAVQEFWIARYPVTYTQYRSFVASEDGYPDPRWWEDFVRTYTEPGDQFPGYGNHPAVNVLWCEAVAFCRWLGAKMNQSIRLPTEWEWRRAAAGERCRALYPWGDIWRGDAANTAESGLNRPTAVGLYPRGASPVGALDMAGNVWEWCLNAMSGMDGSDPRDAHRATLGGSWNSVRKDIAIGHRGGYDLAYRNLNTGFRVIRVEASGGTAVG